MQQTIQQDMRELEQHLHQHSRYRNLTLQEDDTALGGLVYGIDMSDAEKSVPEGENTGPFATLDDPESHIPAELRSLCEGYDVEFTVLGHGGASLHIHIKHGNA